MHRFIILSLLLLVTCGDSSSSDGEREGRDPDLANLPDERADTENRALRRRLQEETITFSFEGKALLEALELIRLEKSFNVVIDDQIRADLEGVRVTLSVTGLELDSTLDLLLRLAGPKYTYALRQGVVVVTDRDRAAENPILRVHPADRRIGLGPRFVAPNLILKPAGAETDESQPPVGNGEEEAGDR